MNPASSTPTRPDAHVAEQVLANALAEALGGAISAQANAAWQCRCLPEGAKAEASAMEAAVAVELRLGGGLTGRLFLSVDTAAASALLDTLGSVSGQDSGQAWLTLCNAAGEILLASSTPPFEGLTINSFQLVPTAPEESHLMAAFELTTPQGTRGALVAVVADAALVASLERLGSEARIGAAPSAEAGEDPGAQIERVIDVPLTVTLRFGQRHLTLREVLALNTGSLVELDRQVEEPVELVLGDRLIARGEVVIVDGNYGLRVTEIVQGAANRIRRAHAATVGESPAREGATA